MNFIFIAILFAGVTWAQAVIDGTTYPICRNPVANATTDSMGRQWGWENNASCVVPSPSCSAVPPIKHINNPTYSGTGVPGNTDLRRYWDCSRQECSNAYATLSKRLPTCNANEQVIDNDVQPSMICSDNQQPKAINDEYSYAYVSVPMSMSPGGASDTCGRCLEIVIGAKTASGVNKKLLTQICNNGVARFDLQVPGAGIGDFDSCHPRYAGKNYDFGEQQAGFSNDQLYPNVGACDKLPPVIQPGCQWLFNWYQRNNEVVSYSEIECPAYFNLLARK